MDENVILSAAALNFRPPKMPGGARRICGRGPCGRPPAARRRVWILPSPPKVGV